MSGKGTRDQLLNIRQIIKKCYEFNITAIYCFLDYTKTFDTIKWNLLWLILKEMGVSDHLITIIKMIYANNQAYVRVESDFFESFQIGQGVDKVAYYHHIYLCTIYREWIMRQAMQEWNGHFFLGGKKISNLRYVGDTVLLAKTEMEMANFLELVEIFSNEAGLKLFLDQSAQ